MKIIISRKGFDGEYGGIPSPIFPDGRILSLPIPSRAGRPLQELQAGTMSMHQLVSDLGAKLEPTSTVHLDPDLCASTVARQTGWRPSFGQVAQAQAHLRNQTVGVGDVFLFFGWYRPVDFDQRNGRWCYVPGAADMHSLFGWMQVQDILDASDPLIEQEQPWLADHPHVAHRGHFSSENVIYVGAPTLSSAHGGMPGAGAFTRWSPQLRLTDASQHLKSRWSVPSWMSPVSGRRLSYHTDLKRWTVQGTSALLQTVGKGQEFVIDVGEDTEPQRWLTGLIAQHA